MNHPLAPNEPTPAPPVVMEWPAPSVKRCPETRAHYAHDWYGPTFRVSCPGGPDETTVGLCWHDSGVEVPGSAANATWRCELRAGHAGAHEAQRGRLGTAIWPSEDDQ